MTELGMETFLQIYIYGAASGLDLLAATGTIELGHVLTDENGFGELRLSSFGGIEGGNPLPAGFAPMAGDLVTFVDTAVNSLLIAGLFANA